MTTTPNASFLEASRRDVLKAGGALTIAFWLPADAVCVPLTLADRKPHPGDRVWLAASVSAGASKDARLHPAQVIEIGQRCPASI